MKIPHKPPEIMAAYNGFLYFNVTPYNAGSVTPANRAEIPAPKAICFKFLSLAFIETASAAAPCAIFAASIAGKIKTSGVAAEAIKKIGANAQCIPVITISGIKADIKPSANQPAFA